jgi:hypothetical protein
VSVFLSDVETGSWPNGTVEQLAARTARLLVTQGDKGADEFDAAGNMRHIPPVPVGAGPSCKAPAVSQVTRARRHAAGCADQELLQGAQQGAASAPRLLLAGPGPLQVEAVDTNGAGDTFATVYMLALARGEKDPGVTASLAASRAVMQPQSCKPDCAPALFADVIRPLSLWDRLRQALLRLVDAVPRRPREVAEQLVPASVLQAVQQMGWWGARSESQ